MDETMRQKTMILALEFKEILEKGFVKKQKATDSDLARLKAIRDEIQSMGLVITWVYRFDYETLNVEVEVQCWEPKINLSPEDQKKYDEWFAQVNHFQPP